MKSQTKAPEQVETKKNKAAEQVETKKNKAAEQVETKSDKTPNKTDSQLSAKDAAQPTGSCKLCKKPIEDDRFVKVGENEFHAECFNCDQCQKPLVGDIFIFEGQAFCKRCYPIRKKDSCMGCQQRLGQTAVEVGGVMWHRECVRCYECQKPIAGDFMRAPPGLFHKECMKCKVCHKSIMEGFCVYMDQLHCQECYDSVAPHCNVCECVIEGELAQVGNNKYHEDCFRCQMCQNKLITADWEEWKGLPYCSKRCARKEQEQGDDQAPKKAPSRHDYERIEIKKKNNCCSCFQKKKKNTKEKSKQ